MSTIFSGGSTSGGGSSRSSGRSIFSGGSATGATTRRASSSRSIFSSVAQAAASSGASTASSVQQEARRYSAMPRPQQRDYLARVARAHQSRTRAGRKTVGGFLRNLAGDGIDTVTGTWSALQLAGKGVAYLPARGVEASLGLGGGNSFTRTIQQGLRDFREGVEDDYQEAGRAVVADYKHRWGPLFSGDFGTAWDRFYENPGLGLMDVAAVYSAAGAGTRIGARAGATVAGDSKFGQALAKVGEKSILPAGVAAGARASTGARYKPPKRFEQQLGENSEARVAIDVPRRPYSRNPITRAPQKAVSAGAQRFAAFLERQAESHPAVLGEFSQSSKFERAASRVARDMNYATNLQKNRQVAAVTGGFARQVRHAAGTSRARSGRGRRGSAAVYLHATDLLDVPGVTPAQARARVVEFLEKGITEAKSQGLRTRRRERELQAIRDVPENQLDLRTAAPQLRTAVARAKEISTEATRLRVASGRVRQETADARMRRTAEIIHGDSRFDPRLRRNTPELVEAATRFEHARTVRDAMKPMPTRENYVNVGRRIGRAERNLELSPKLPKARQHRAGLPVEGRDFLPDRGGQVPDPGSLPLSRLNAAAFSRYLASRMDPTGAARIPHSLGPGTPQAGVTKGRARSYESVLMGRAKQSEFRRREQGLRSARREANLARQELARVEKRAKGDWTPPMRPGPDGTPVRAEGLGRNAVYFPDEPAEKFAGGKPPAGESSEVARFTADGIRQNKGSLLESGNVSTDSRLLSRAYEKALVDDMQPKALADLIDSFAYRGRDGEIAKGRRAVIALEADPDKVVLVSERTLANTMRNARNRPPDQPVDVDLTSGMQILEGPEGAAVARQAFEAADLGGGGDLVALPKAVVDAWREGYSQRSLGKWGSRLYDTPLQLWRRGILALAPRWYLNNLFGNTLMYGLLAGPDIRSILQARRGKPLAEATPERVAATLVDETRLSSQTEAHTRARRGFERLTDTLMGLNHALESLIRRAAYISRAKASLRQEGVSLRGLTAREVADGIEQMPQAMKDQVIREVEMGMGDYVRMGTFERNVAKRIFPFYSWMRVIGRLMATLPIQHPKRVGLTALVSAAATEVENPEDFMLPLYNRGRVNIGDFSVRTMAANPFTTHAELLANVAERDLPGVASSLARDVTPIGGQQAVQLVTGRNQFGRPFTAPPGHDGGMQSFGGQRMRPGVLGLPEEYVPSPPLHELLLQSVPLGPQLLRDLAAGSKNPYDTASTFDLIRRNWFDTGPPEAEVFRPESDYPMASKPLTVNGQPLTPFLSLLGLNTQRRDRGAEMAIYLDALERQSKRAADTAKARLKMGLEP